MAREVAVEGLGLHTAARARVVLRARPGAISLRQGASVARVDELSVVDVTRATTVANRTGGVRVSTVEHLFSALAGLGIHDGLEIAIDGPEMPILDGSARAWCDALRGLELAPGRPSLVVAHDDTVEVGRSRMTLRRGARVLSVRLGLDDPRIDPEACFSFDVDDYLIRIAPSRTFALEAEVASLIEQGLARHVPAEAAVVIGTDRVMCHGRPFASAEPACHKLLDLMGDLYLYGGPPRGSLHVERPGHAANHRLVSAALERGSLARGS